MAQLQPPPYQDKAGTQRWSEWYRQINDLLSEVSTSINAIDDVEVLGATQGDILYWNATDGEWQNTESPTVPGNLDVEGTTTLVGAVDVESYIDLAGIAEPGAPAAGVARMFSTTENGFTRIGRINEAGELREFSRDQFLTVRNMTGGTLTKGTPVYINGANGLVPTMAAADAASSATTADGILMADTGNTAYGQVMVIGLLQNIDTSSYSAGNDLYLASGGGLTATAPTTPNIVQKVASVVVANPSVGSLFVDIRGIRPDSLGSSGDVEIEAYNDGDILVWNDTAEVWEDSEAPIFTTLDVEGVATFNDEIESESAADGIGIDDGNYIYALERGVANGPTIKFNTHGTHLYYLDLRSGASTNGFEIIHTSRNAVYGDGAHFYLLNAAHNSAAENSNAGIALGGVNSFEKVATFTPQPNTGNINYFRFESNTTGLDPILSIESLSDTNVGMDIVPLGTGVINVANQIMGPITSVTAATHAVDAEADRYLICDSTSNNIDVELPAASTAGNGYRLDVKAIDVTNNITINENGTDEIDGAASVGPLALYDNVSLLCTGSTWYII